MTFNNLLSATAPYETVLHPEVFRWLSLLLSINNLRLVLSGLLLGVTGDFQQILSFKKKKLIQDFFEDSHKELPKKRLKQVSPTNDE